MPKSNHKPFPKVEGPQTQAEYFSSIGNRLDNANVSLQGKMQMLESKANELDNYNQKVLSQAPPEWKDSPLIAEFNSRVSKAPNPSVDANGYAIPMSEAKKRMAQIKYAQSSLNSAVDKFKQKHPEAFRYDAGNEDQEDQFAAKEQEALNKIREQM
jgi:hypothetical protein